MKEAYFTIYQMVNTKLKLKNQNLFVTYSASKRRTSQRIYCKNQKRTLQGQS